MAFGKKLKDIRLSLNLSQSQLAKMTGISERSLYTYEQTGMLPRSSNLRKIADALGVSANYLLSEGCDDTPESASDAFVAHAKSEFGSRGTKEASELISRATALFAGGELNDEGKELFFQSIAEIYLESKREARNKFSSKKRAGRSKSAL